MPTVASMTLRTHVRILVGRQVEPSGERVLVRYAERNENFVLVVTL
jgi:hypothetical protein